MNLKKTFTAIVAMISAAGIGYVANTTDVEPNDKRLVLDAPNTKIVAEIVETRDDNGEIIGEDKNIWIAQKRFDKNTGEEIIA